MIPVNVQVAAPALAFALVGVWLLLLRLNKIRKAGSRTALKMVPTALSLVLLFSWVFSVSVWRFPVFQRWLVRIPVLDGNWEGEIISTWKDSTGKRPNPIPAKLFICQSLWGVSCKVVTREMTSRSFVAAFFSDPESHEVRLSYSYTSVPSPTVRDRSAIHLGASVLDWSPETPDSLSGNYWTDRKTTGELRFQRMKK